MAFHCQYSEIAFGLRLKSISVVFCIFCNFSEIACTYLGRNRVGRGPDSIHNFINFLTTLKLHYTLNAYNREEHFQLN